MDKKCVCGWNNPQEAKFCRNCGNNLSKKTTNWKTPLLVVVAVLGGLILLNKMFSGSNDSSSPPMSTPHDVDSSSDYDTSFNKCPYDVEEVENYYKDTYRLWCASVRNGVNSWDEIADWEKVTRLFDQIDYRGDKILKHSDCQTEAIRLRNFVNPLKAEIQQFNSNTRQPFSCRSIFNFNGDRQEEQQAVASDNSDALYNGCERNCIHLNNLCNSAGLLGADKDCSAEYDNCLSRCRN